MGEGPLSHVNSYTLIRVCDNDDLKHLYLDGSLFHIVSYAGEMEWSMAYLGQIY